MNRVVTHNKIIIIYWLEVKQSDAITHQIKNVCPRQSQGTSLLVRGKAKLN